MEGDQQQPGDTPPPDRGERPVQQSIDFSSLLNERLALIRSLEAPLAYLGPAQSTAIMDLLERILLAAVKSEDGWTSHARKSYLAAGLAGHRTVSERTIQTWCLWAEELGLVDVDRRSHKFGGPRSNAWHICPERLKELASPLDFGRKSGRSRGEATSPPGEKPLPPVQKLDKQVRQQTTSPTPPGPLPSATWVEVEEVLFDLELSDSKIKAILSRRRRMKETPSEFLKRVATGLATIKAAANVPKLTSPVGALGCYLATGNWPVPGIVDPERATKIEQARSLERRRKAWETIAFNVLRQANLDGCDAAEMRRRLLAANLPPEYVEERLR